MFVFVFNFVFYHLELSSTVVQPVHHGHGHYRGLSVRQTSSLLETGRTDVGSGQVVPPNTFVDAMAGSVRFISSFIAVFSNMRTLKFKPQLTVYVFRCRQSSKRTSWETEAHLSRVKRSRLSVVIGRFRSILFVSVFQGSLAVAIIMIDGSEKPNRQLGFELQSSHVIKNRNNNKET